MVFWVLSPIADLLSPQFESFHGLFQSIGFPNDWRLYVVCAFMILTWFPLVWLLGVVQVLVARAFLAPSAKNLELRLAEATRMKIQTDQAETTSLRQIERDLHDGPQQALLRTGLDLATAERRLAEEDYAAVAELLAEARLRNEQTLSEIRRISRGFAPQILAERGLGEALNSLVATSPVPCDLQLSISSDARFSSTVEKTLYFATSEALANIIKHSGATKATISLSQEPDALVLQISDDGSDGAKFLPGHGLDGLRNRLQALGGTLRLDSQATTGTTLIATIPTSEG
jgi:signal transduction histidine kinase